MPTDNENSMTNVEQAEKYWQQFLTAPALTDDDKAIAKQHHDVLLTAFARSSFLAETLIQKPSFISLSKQPIKIAMLSCKKMSTAKRPLPWWRCIALRSIQRLKL